MPVLPKIVMVIAIVLSGLLHALGFIYYADELGYGDKQAVSTTLSVKLKVNDELSEVLLEKDKKNNSKIYEQQLDREFKKLTEIISVESKMSKQLEKAPAVSDTPVFISSPWGSSSRGGSPGGSREKGVNEELKPEIKKNVNRLSEAESRGITGEQKKRLLSLLYSEINAHKKYPYMAIRQRREGFVKVNFMLHPDGQISNVSIVESSRYGLLDDAARTAVEDVSPFQMAENYLSQIESFNVNIDFRLN